MATKIKHYIFAEMKKAFREAAAFERGKMVNLQVTQFPSDPGQHPVVAKYAKMSRARRIKTIRSLSEDGVAFIRRFFPEFCVEAFPQS